MIELLMQINPDFDHIEESPLIIENKIVGWETSIKMKDGFTPASGFKLDKNESRRTAFAEYVERQFVLQSKANPERRAEWAIDIYPSACGFAVGFNEQKTIVRSIVEGVERWAMTEWIMGQRPLAKATPSLDKIGHKFLEVFSHCQFYHVAVPILFGGIVSLVHVAIVLGFSENGVYPGSNASTSQSNLWNHACLESYRHWLCVKNSVDTGRFPHNRIFYFSKNSDIALQQIPKGDTTKWPSPEIEFFKKIELYPSIFIARTIMKGYEAWSTGPIDQFLY